MCLRVLSYRYTWRLCVCSMLTSRPNLTAVSTAMTEACLPVRQRGYRCASPAWTGARVTLFHAALWSEQDRSSANGCFTVYWKSNLCLIGNSLAKTQLEKLFAAREQRAAIPGQRASTHGHLLARYKLILELSPAISHSTGAKGLLILPCGTPGTFTDRHPWWVGMCLMLLHSPDCEKPWCCPCRRQGLANTTLFSRLHDC